MSERLGVLYAEDERSDADLTRAHFEENAPELELDVVDTGRQCLARLERRRYDVLLLDNRLPDMEGTDVLKELAAREITLPVVVVTAAGDEALVVRVLRLGACDYVPKQGNYIETLPAILKNAVDEHRDVPEEERAFARQPRRVLYVEHNAADIDLTLRHFDDVAAPFRVEIVRSSARAQDRLAEEEFHLVLIDLRMPDGCALDFLREVRRRKRRVPVVIVTGRGDEEAAAASLRLGAYDYVVKQEGYLIQLPHVIDHAIARFQLRRLNHRLEGEVAERRRAEAALETQAAALAEAARQKDEFLAMLGHELRNPLAPIRTALELLLRFDYQDEVVVEALDVMSRQVAHMVHLLDDLLEVARITSGRITLDTQEVDLRRIVDEAIGSTRSAIEARRHRLEASLPAAPLPVFGDVTRLVQVVVNLLHNAAKYTDEGGTIRIGAIREGRHAVLRVIDNGAGIPTELLPAIFDPFTQGDRTLDRAQGGLGLGLTLVRRITELHGGTVEALSEGRGKGSEFVVRLPLRVPKAAGTPVQATRSGGPPHQHLRCLVVEDNPDAARMLAVALELEGHQVELAFDGRQAVDAAATFRPDAVVLDVGLPRMNGYDAARAIRRLPGLADVPIIALTGYGLELDRNRSREAGFDHHLVKPVSMGALLRVLSAERPAHRDP